MKIVYIFQYIESYSNCWSWFSISTFVNWRLETSNNLLTSSSFRWVAVAFLLPVALCMNAALWLSFPTSEPAIFSVLLCSMEACIHKPWKDFLELWSQYKNPFTNGHSRVWLHATIGHNTAKIVDPEVGKDNYKKLILLWIGTCPG